MLMEILSIVLGVVLLWISAYGGQGFALYRLGFLIDIPSFIIMLVFTVPVLCRRGMWQDFSRAWKLLQKRYSCHLSELRRTLDVVEMMQKQIIYAGIIGTLMSFIVILHNLDDPASIGPNLAVSILVMMYAVFFELLLLPLQLEAKRRIIDYMKVDTDEEYAGEAEVQKEEEREEKKGEGGV